ncbi:thermonuclease family protein [Roseiarcaceae bacterium H3SJ34-1]|uniref:thermonuclease family protein n=1 Tax=Terripilifer ovatus TaxID=3032367 RepID=UPI003AB97B2D|nr:thermonuclease family protein [Roseiarcaceae bacterium H3SJ34-1]
MFTTKGSNEKLPGAILLAFCLFAPPAFAQSCDTPAGEPVEVASLEPHFELKLADGRLVRLAGIEPVRATPDNPDFPAKAAADLELWSVGAQVALTALDQTPDRWGRVRARVFLPPDNLGLAKALIEAGWARVDPLSEATACLPALYQAEAEARAEKRGLWADPAYAVFDQAENPDFTGLGGRIVVVSGTVGNVNTGRYRTFVNLGRDRRKSLTVTLSARTVREFTTAGLAPQSLAGRNLRVRGLLDTRFGPRIEVYTPGAIELLGGAPASTANSDWHAAIPAKPAANR